MRSWISKHRRNVIRAFALLNVAYAVVGAYALVQAAVLTAARLSDSAKLPYVFEVYCVTSGVNAACIIALVVSGVFLWRVIHRGLTISNIVFVAEIIWFLGATALALFLQMQGGSWALFGVSIAGAAGIGGVGTAPQILTGYPLLALLALNSLRGSFTDGPVAQAQP